MSGARRQVLLDEAALGRLRRAVEMGITQARLAKRFGVSTQTIRRALLPSYRPSERQKTEAQPSPR